MSREEVLSQLIEFAAKSFGKDAAAINEKTNISEELGKKSVQVISMCSLIENEYDVMIAIGDLLKFETMGDLTDYVMEEM